MSNPMIYALMFGSAVFMLVFSLGTPVFGERSKARKQIKHRLQAMEESSSSAVSKLIRQTKEEKLSSWQVGFESIEMFGSLRNLIEQSAVQTCVANLLALSFGLLIASFMAVLIFTKIFWLACIVGFVIATIPTVLLVFKSRKRMEEFEEQLPEAIDTMKRSLQSGFPLIDSFRIIADETSGPCSTEFGLVFLDISYGATLEGAFNALLFRMPSVTLMALTSSILIQNETGGNLSEILDKIAGGIRGRFRFHRKVKTLTAEGRLSAWILALIPFVLAGILALGSPDYLKPLTEDARGHDLIQKAFIAMMLGIWWMRSILRVDV